MVKKEKKKRPPWDQFRGDRDDDEDDDEDEEGWQWDPRDLPNFRDLGKIFPPKFQEAFGDIIREVMKNFNPRTFAKLTKEIEKQMREGGTNRPAVFGFSMGLGPDGKPTLNPFGNVAQKGSGPKVKEVREPLTDIIEEDEELIVVAEIPGIKKSDIELSATDHTLTIRANSQDLDRKYEKTIELPCRINPNVARARYTHGILEVKLQKRVPKKDPGSKIPID